jgi:hypothetical protein
MNTENLKKLADYLLSDKLRAKFDMSVFSDHSHMDYAKNCGSVGCAVGHGPYAGIPKNVKEYWRDYSHRVFEIGGNWDWCFNNGWVNIDNTPPGSS